jgi:hypothetical protein
MRFHSPPCPSLFTGAAGENDIGTILFSLFLSFEEEERKARLSAKIIIVSGNP